MHNRSKALSNLTHSTLLVQSRSFNKLWNLMTKRNQFNNFGKTITTFFGQERFLGPCELSISSKCIPDHCCERPFSYMILYIIMSSWIISWPLPQRIEKTVNFFLAIFVKGRINLWAKYSKPKKQGGQLKTSPKAQQTQGLSSSYQSNFLRSYHKFKHKSHHILSSESRLSIN